MQDEGEQYGDRDTGGDGGDRRTAEQNQTDREAGEGSGGAGQSAGGSMGDRDRQWMSPGSINPFRKPGWSRTGEAIVGKVSGISSWRLGRLAHHQLQDRHDPALGGERLH